MTKTCKGPCGNSYPATEEYFAWNNRKRGHLRTYCHHCYKVRKARYARTYRKKRKEGTPVDQEVCPRLPVGPLRDYLKTLSQFDNPNQIADAVGVEGATMQRIMVSGQTVSLDVVDKILTYFQMSPWLLPVLYPELYDFSPRQMAKAEEWANEV